MSRSQFSMLSLCPLACALALAAGSADAAVFINEFH